MPTPRKFQFILNYPRTSVVMSVSLLVIIALIVGIADQSVITGIIVLAGISILCLFLCLVVIYVALFRVIWVPQELDDITEPTHFNTNHEVKVKLTEYGLGIYEEYLRQQEQLLRPTFANKAEEYVDVTRAMPDEDGYYKFQLYVLISIFGGAEHMPDYATSVGDIPFETEIILLPS